MNDVIILQTENEPESLFLALNNYILCIFHVYSCFVESGICGKQNRGPAYVSADLVVYRSIRTGPKSLKYDHQNKEASPIAQVMIR